MFFIDLAIGINTKAPEMRSIVISGPSIRGEEVKTTKQRAAQNRVSMTLWVFVSGFLIAFVYG